MTDTQSHAFMAPGPFTITLTVLDDDGGSTSVTFLF
ncbi:MAG: PKD domain-containing protein [Thermoplasmata archaeon]